MIRDIRRGSIEMAAAMLISGTIGWFVLVSGQSVENVVFWRCAFGAVALSIICGALGYLKPGIVTRRQLGIAVLGGFAIVSNWLLLFAAYPKSSISIPAARAWSRIVALPDSSEGRIARSLPTAAGAMCSKVRASASTPATCIPPLWAKALRPT